MNDHTWTLRVTAADHRAARVACRRQQFTVTRPLSFDSEHPGVTALEYALGAIGAELVTGLQELARRRRLELENLEVLVVGALRSPLAYLEVVGEERDSAVSRVRLKVYVTSSEPAEAIDRLVHEAVEILPLTRTFRSLVQLEVHINHTP